MSDTDPSDKAPETATPEKANGENGAAPNQTSEDQATQPALRLLDRYVKDLSFENPNAPLSLNPMLPTPKFEAEVGVNGRQIGPEQFEVELSCAITARHDTNTTYVIEVNYAGLFIMQNMDQDMIERAMLVDCPSILFPHLRLIIAESTNNGGFTPLTMDPVNFLQMYEQQKKAGTLQSDGAPNSGT